MIYFEHFQESKNCNEYCIENTLVLFSYQNFGLFCFSSCIYFAHVLNFLCFDANPGVNRLERVQKERIVLNTFECIVLTDLLTVKRYSLSRKKYITVKPGWQAVSSRLWLTFYNCRCCLKDPCEYLGEQKKKYHPDFHMDLSSNACSCRNSSIVYTDRFHCIRVT